MTFIDLTPYRCPMGLVKLKLALKKLAQNEEVQILISDASSRQDITRFLEKAQYQLVELQNDRKLLVLSTTKPLAN